MFITNSSQGPGGQKLVFNCQVPRWFWLDGLEKALNKNTINFGFLPISFFSFAGDKEREKASLLFTATCVWPGGGMELRVNKRKLLIKNKSQLPTKNGRHGLGHRVSTLPCWV